MFLKYIKSNKEGLNTPLEKFIAGAILALYDLVFVVLGLVMIAGCNDSPESPWWGPFMIIVAIVAAVFWYFWPRCGWNIKKTLRAIKKFYFSEK